jgi:hypothetical protein
MKRQATLLSFCSTSTDKTDDIAKCVTTVQNIIINQPIAMKEKEKGLLRKECLPKDKCHGTFELRHLTSY